MPGWTELTRMPSPADAHSIAIALANSRTPPFDARIRDQNVQSAKARYRFGNHFHPARLAGHILMKKHRGMTGFFDAGDKLGSPEVVDIGYRNGCAFARQ
jgi:hypothetical protein